MRKRKNSERKFDIVKTLLSKSINLVKSKILWNLNSVVPIINLILQNIYEAIYYEYLAVKDISSHLFFFLLLRQTE